MTEPELVGSGSFRVDRARALAKLKKFQLQGLGGCLAALLRAAVAGGATRVEIVWRGATLSLRFDGKPLSSDEQLRPFDAIFQNYPSPRARLWAEGLLAICRLSDGPPVVTGGEGDGRRAIRLDLEGVDEVAAAPAMTKATHIQARVRREPKVKAVILEQLRRDAALLPCRLAINDRLEPRFNPRPPGSFFRRGAVRGWIGLPMRLERPSQLHLSYLGMGAGTREAALAEAPVEAWINDDRGATDLSGSAADSARRGRNLKFLRVEVLRLILKIIGEQPFRMRRALRILVDPLAQDAWRRRSDWGAMGDPDGLDVLENMSTVFSGGGARQKRLHEVLWAAHITFWLRELVVRHVVLANGKVPPRLASALGSAPIFFGRYGELYSYERLREETVRGYVWTTRVLFPNELDRKRVQVWCSSARESTWLQRTLGAVRAMPPPR